MGRAQFGGGPDYSSVFASLYSATAERPTVVRPQLSASSGVSLSQSKAEREAEQAAEDQDIFDQWSNGLIDDDELLAYIERRVKETSGDAKEHQKWVKYQRYYTDGIADARAVEAYETTGDANALVAHWEKRAAAVEPNSEEGRTVADKLREAREARASKDVNTGARRIAEQIELGEATPRDLLRFYQEQRKLLPAGSAVRESLSAEIDSIESQIRTSKADAESARIAYEFDAGKISGKVASDRYRALAEQFKTSDEQKYYQLLNTALGYAEYGNRTGGGGGSGGGGRSGGGGGVGGGGSKSATPVTVFDHLDVLDGQYTTLFNRIFEEMNKRGGELGFTVKDPRSGSNYGQPILITEGNLKALTDKYLRTKDALATAWENRVTKTGKPYSGREDKARAVRESKDKVLEQVAVPLGTVPFNRALSIVVNNGLKQIGLMAGATNADPNDVLEAERKVSETIRRFANLAKKDAAGSTTPGVLPGQSLTVPDFHVDIEAINEALAIADALDAGAAPPSGNPIADAQVADDLSSRVGKNIVGSTTLSAAMDMISEARTQADGLANGSLVYLVTEDGISVAPGKGGQIDASQVDVGNGMLHKGTLQVKGENVVAWYVAQPATYKDFRGQDTPMWWANGVQIDGKSVSGRALTGRELEQLQSDEAVWAQALTYGQVTRETFYIPGVYVVNAPSYTDNGRAVEGGTFYIDAVTGAASQFLPVDFVGTSDGFAQINPDGTANVQYGAFSTDASMPFIGLTNNPEKLQAEINGGRLDLQDALPTRKRGEAGEPFAEQVDWSTAFHDPAETRLESEYIHRSRTGDVAEGFGTKLAKAIRKRRSAVEQALNDRLTADAEAEGRTNVDPIKEAEQRFGIRISGGKLTPTNPRPAPAPAPSKGDLSAPVVTLPKLNSSGSIFDILSAGIESALKLPKVTTSTNVTRKKPSPAVPKKKPVTKKSSDSGVAPSAATNRHVAF